MLQNRSDSSAWAEPSLGIFTVNAARNSGSTFQFDDGKMPSAFDVCDCEPNRDSILASRLKANDIFLDSEIDVHRNSSTERLMWTMPVVPICIKRNLLSDVILAQWDENASGVVVHRLSLFPLSASNSMKQGGLCYR